MLSKSVNKVSISQRKSLNSDPESMSGIGSRARERARAERNRAGVDNRNKPRFIEKQ
jgi:hypothetical protein